MRRLLLLLLLLLACEKPQPPTPAPNPTPVVVGGVARGFTLEDTSDVPKIVSVIKSLGWRPWVRIVFHYPDKPSVYAHAVQEISKVAEIIGQPSDSVYSSKLTVNQFAARFKSYVDTFPQINIWETTNEANMCDNCNPVEHTKLIVAQADAALKIVKAAGKKAMFTPYWNTENCADKNGEYYEWTRKNISTFVKTETDYVALSIYGFDCDGGEPSHTNIDSELDRFRVLFPSANVMVGEYGKQGSVSVLKHYRDYPRVGAGLYWHGSQDIISGKLLQEFKK